MTKKLSNVALRPWDTLNSVVLNNPFGGLSELSRLCYTSGQVMADSAMLDTKLV